MKPKAGFTAAQVDTLLAQPKVILIEPRLVERDGFARLTSSVLVENERDIGLVMEAHYGLRSEDPSPNVVLRWSNIRVRGIDCAAVHKNVPGLPPIEGWHEHLWDDAYGDRRLIAVSPNPPLGLRSFFDYAARRWNIRILRANPRLDLENPNG